MSTSVDWFYYRRQLRTGEVLAVVLRLGMGMDRGLGEIVEGGGGG